MTPDKCLKCGQVKVGSRSGSITQWVSICRCDIIEEPQEITVDICSSCGKRLTPARPGSFTQWIFGADSCDCQRPKPDPKNLGDPQNLGETQPLPTRRAQTIKMGLSLDLPENIEEYHAPDIDVDSQTFPVERFKPLQKIESGASGKVYLCWDKDLRRKAAVKILQTLTADQVVSFQNEAKLTARLKHPNIVSILDFGMSGDTTPYMVLEFVNGFNLEKIVKERGPLRLDLAIDLFVQVCDALEYAHQSGVFHRDIKSSNIIVSEREHIFAHVIDFGVASFAHLNQEPTLFQGRSIVGTPTYMSPDQVLGLPFDARSEIYSFGCVMFEVLTGQLPFEGQNALAVLGRHATEETPTMNSMLDEGNIPEELEAVVAKCLSKNPDERFQSMRSLQTALEDIQPQIIAKMQLQSDAEQQLFPSEEPEVLEEHKSERKTAFVIGSLLSLILIAVAAGWFLLFGRSQPTVKMVPLDRKSLHEKLFLDPEASGLEKSELFTITAERNGVRVTGAFSTKDSDLKALEKRNDITVLDLGRTNVDGSGLKYVVKNPIGFLDLGSTHVSDEVFTHIAKMKTLEYLVLKSSAITDEGLKNVLGLPLLKVLNLANTNVTDKALQIASQIPTLRLLDISYTKVKGSGFVLLKSPALERVDVSSDDQPQSFFEHLKDLNIRGLGIHGKKSIPLDYIRFLNHRRYIAFVQKPVSGEELGELAKLSFITLDLDSTGLTDEKIGKLKGARLKRIGLHKEMITDAGLLKLEAIPNLNHVMIDYCGGITDDGIKALRQSRPKVNVVDKQSLR